MFIILLYRWVFKKNLNFRSCDALVTLGYILRVIHMLTGLLL